MLLKSNVKLAVAVAAALSMSGLTACGVDDIQLNGKLFDAMGVNTSSVKKDPTLAARQPLVVPPGLDKLPEPGAGSTTPQSGIADIQDHDTKRYASKSDLERQQAEYCKVHYEQAKQHGDANADLAAGPLGPCRGSVFTAVKQWNGGGEPEGGAQ